jgi:hypothetical protein
MKTSKNDNGCSDLPSDPQVVLLVRYPTGQWSSHAFATIGDGEGMDHTRPIVLVDATNGSLYMYANLRDAIVEKISPLSSIAFPAGAGAAVISNATDGKINNVTSMKGNLSASTDLVVLATSPRRTSHHYWHFARSLRGTPP